MASMQSFSISFWYRKVNRYSITVKGISTVSDMKKKERMVLMDIELSLPFFVCWDACRFLAFVSGLFGVVPEFL